MEALLDQRCHLGAKMAGLQKMAPSLQFVHADADQLSKMISFTTTLAIDVSAKVRQLDRAKVMELLCIWVTKQCTRVMQLCLTVSELDRHGHCDQDV